MPARTFRDPHSTGGYITDCPRLGFRVPIRRTQRGICTISSGFTYSITVSHEEANFGIAHAATLTPQGARRGYRGPGAATSFSLVKSFRPPKLIDAQLEASFGA